MDVPEKSQPLLISTHKVWDKSPHSAFTDLCYHNGKFYLAFREADSHERGGNGLVRILESSDGTTFKPFLLVEEEGTDLRDPKLTTHPDGRLYLLMGGSKLDKEGKLLQTGTRVAFIDAAGEISPIYTALDPNEWLWSIAWYQGVGYGAAYHYSKQGFTLSLYQTQNGVDFQQIKEFDIDDWPSETAIRFTPEGEMLLLARRGNNWNTPALLGRSEPPYDAFSWYDAGFSLGGPAFVIAPDQKLWIASRLIYGTPYGLFARTALLVKDREEIFRKLYFPSFGDTGYPGMVLKEGVLFVSYYSTHEKNTAVYVSKVILN